MRKNYEFNGAVKIVKKVSNNLISVRVDLTDKKVMVAVKKVLGCEVPKKLGINFMANGAIAWMSTDELMVSTVASSFKKIFSELTKILKPFHHLVVDISDSRTIFSVSGHSWRDLIAKGSPVNVSSEVLRVGDFRRSRLGMVAIAFWMVDENTINIMCYRSVEEFMFDWLCNAGQINSMPEYFSV